MLCLGVLYLQGFAAVGKMESFVKRFAKYLFLCSLKITIYQIHVDINNIFLMKDHYIFQSKNSEKNDIVV